jgi:hypothetical protein
MDPQVQNILMKSAEYIERTQPLLDKRNEEKAAFVEKATKAANVLATRGVLGKRDVNGFVDKIASDPTAVWEVVEKLAGLVSVDTLGEVGREKVASATDEDPFVRRFFGNNSDAHSGMVD